MKGSDVLLGWWASIISNWHLLDEDLLQSGLGGDDPIGDLLSPFDLVLAQSLDVDSVQPVDLVNVLLLVEFAVFFVFRLVLLGLEISVGTSGPVGVVSGDSTES